LKNQVLKKKRKEREKRRRKEQLLKMALFATNTQRAEERKWHETFKNYQKLRIDLGFVLHSYFQERTYNQVFLCGQSNKK